MDIFFDWQNKKNFKERGQYLLETGLLSDCQFVVGQEPQQQTFEGHKLLLAMASPVFQAMFYGSMAEKNNPIPIKDIQPEAFKALLEYTYTDNVTLSSFELAWDLCYCAKKYMIQVLIEKCMTYLLSCLSPKIACKLYEFAKLIEQPVVMNKCMQLICSRTDEVLNESSWEEVELDTLLTVLEQDMLKINSEVDLFNAVERWAKSECLRKNLDPTNESSLRSVIGNALSKIRFLSLYAHEFANGPGRSCLLTEDESFAILMNMCSDKITLMPEEFSTNMNNRAQSVSSVNVHCVKNHLHFHFDYMYNCHCQTCLAFNRLVLHRNKPRFGFLT